MKSRRLKEISHFFLSSAGQETSRLPTQPGKSACGAGAAGKRPPAHAGLALQKARAGMVIVDQDRIVRHMNTAARRLLSLQGQNPVGEVFNHFIMPGEEREVSIFLENGRPGIGRLVAVSSIQHGAPIMIITISDWSERLKTRSADTPVA